MQIEVGQNDGVDKNIDGSMDNRDFLKTMYEQFWLSQRAGVAERLQLVYIFSVIFAGSLAILKENLINRDNSALIVLLMLFSLWGVLFTLKIDGVLRARENAAENIVNEYKLSKFKAKYNHGNWITKVSIGKLFPIFFSMCFYFLLLILLNIFLPDFQGRILLAVGVSVVLFIVSAIYLSRLKYN